MIYIDPSRLPSIEGVPFNLLDFADGILLEIFERVINFQSLTCQDLGTLNSLKSVCDRFKVILSGIHFNLTVTAPLRVNDFRCLRVARGVHATFVKNFTEGVELREVLDDLLVFIKYNTIVIAREMDGSHRGLQGDYVNLLMFLNSSFVKGRKKAELAEIFYELLNSKELHDFSDANPFTLAKFCSNLIMRLPTEINIPYCMDPKEDSSSQMIDESHLPYNEKLEKIISSEKIVDPLTLSLFFKICTHNPNSDIKRLLQSDRFKSIESPFLYELVAEIFASKDNITEASEYNKKALKLNPDSVFALVESSNYLIHDNKMERDEALGKLNKALKLNPYYVRAWILRGIIYGRMGAYDLALDDYMAALKLNPDDALARINRGALHYWMGSYNLAENDLNIAIKLFPDYEIPRKLLTEIKVKERISKAEYHISNKNNELALADLNVALQLNPNCIPALILRIDVYSKMEMNEQALADLKKAISIDCTHPKVLEAQMILIAKLKRIQKDAFRDHPLKNMDTNKRGAAPCEKDPKRR